MAQLKDIVEREQQRGSIAEARTIHLFPEGSFLRCRQLERLAVVLAYQRLQAYPSHGSLSCWIYCLPCPSGFVLPKARI